MAFRAALGQHPGPQEQPQPGTILAASLHPHPRAVSLRGRPYVQRFAHPIAAIGPRQRRFSGLTTGSVRHPMKSILAFFFQPPTGPASLILPRLAVGLIFFTQGILKFTDPHMGVDRFARIGFPHPYFTAHFVGSFEIVCGGMVLLGLWTRISSIPLLMVISTAIASTKVPELTRANQGFWYMVSDARTDFAMLCCLIFLILQGGGPWSLDHRDDQDV